MQIIAFARNYIFIVYINCIIKIELTVESLTDKLKEIMKFINGKIQDYEVMAFDYKSKGYQPLMISMDLLKSFRHHMRKIIMLPVAYTTLTVTILTI